MSEYIELSDERERLGLNYGRTAINNHSIRHYEHKDSNAGIQVVLDRVTDLQPRYFQAYMVGDSANSREFKLLFPVKIDGKTTFGDGLSWKKAEQLLFTHLENEEAA